MSTGLTIREFAVTLMPVDWIYGVFGRRLREARVSKGLSQQQVADQVGLARTSVTNIERGSQHLPLHMAYRLAAVVGEDLKKLLPDSDAPVPESDAFLPAAMLKELSAVERAWVQRIVSQQANGSLEEGDKM